MTLLEESTDESEIEVTEKKKRVPRRVLHFSDGILEEYSSDEDDNDGTHIKKTTVSEVNAVNPQTLTWGPWVWYKTVTASSKTLRACDYVGEKLAKFFGITTPKYEYEIDVYESLKLQEEEEKKQRDLEMGGWAGAEDTSLQTSAPNETR
ncbi:protein FAM177A1-like isoform X2 [Lycorma delicatula]|uniref:protein FAM177A1-like isoform X2 n=1 Tax=Lycorma delicatula TaxID=130591 RepID=UPI003F515D13